MMRIFLRISALVLAIALVTACSQSTVATDSQNTGESATPAVTPIVTSASATTSMLSETAEVAVTPTLYPSFSPVPLPTGNVPDLPDPGNWAATLKLEPGDYPRVDGSTATIPLAVYMRSKITGATLQDSAAATAFSTTGPAWLALAKREKDLLVVYEAPDEVKQQIEENGVKLAAKPIGLDALVFLTNTGNPVSGLTHSQLLDIYTGRTTNWKQVGGEDVAIIPYQRPSNSGSQALMLKLVMKNMMIMDVPKIFIPTEMDELIIDVKSYANSNNAIGYSVYYYVRNMFTLPGIKLLSVDGVAPSSDTIASGAYPYINPFYAVIRTDEPAGTPARKLFDWLTGAEGKRAITDAGYVAAK